jgi:hypothetical protein
MTTDAARRAVLDTPELIENIILCLPVKDLFAKVQRLSRSWKAVVDSSVAVQTKLWLRPQSDNVIQPAKYSNDHTFAHYSDWLQELASPMYPSGVVLNPFLRNKFGSFSSTPSSPVRESKGYPFFLIFQTRPKGVDKNDQAAVEISQSWRGMFLTEPPITTASLQVYFYKTSEQRHDAIMVDSVMRDHNGITLGLFHDICWASAPLDRRGNPGYLRGDLIAFFERFDTFT